MIEAANARTRNMDQHPINCLFSGFVGVESLQQKMAEKTAALRDAHRINAFYRRDLVVVTFEVGSEITHRGEPEADHDRIARAVDHLVNFASLEPAVQMNRSQPQPEFPGACLHKLPFAARNGPPRCHRRVAYSQHIGWIIRIDAGVFRAANLPTNYVAERMLHHLLVHDKVGADQTGDRLIRGSFHDRRIQPHQTRLIAHIPLPTDPHQCHTTSHQETVTEFFRGRGIRRPFGILHHAQHPFAAAIRDLDECGAARSRRLLRLKNVNVGGELDLALCVARRFLQINDDSVRRGIRLYREENLADQLLIRAGVTKSFSRKDVRTRKNLNAFDACLDVNSS